METFHTSYCKPLDLIVDADGRGLHFRSIPRGKAFDRLIVRLVGRNEQEAASYELNRYGRHLFSTGGIPNGGYSLEVFSLTDEYGRFRSYVQNNESIVRITNGIPSFSEPWCLRSNNSVIRRFSRSERTIRQLLSSDESYPSNHPDVRRLAASITTGIHDDYGKLLAVHDWVAENIFYDYDALRRSGSRIVALDRSTINVLRTRRAVCQGYSDLAVSLLRACGIPSASVGCFALGESSKGGWERAENRNAPPNHAFTTALIFGRYVLIDITWDSDNEYSNGRYKHKTGHGKSRKFFDVSAQLFSASHRLILPSYNS